MSANPVQDGRLAVLHARVSAGAGRAFAEVWLAFDEAQEEQQDARADGRGDDGAQPPGSDRWQLEQAPEPTADEGADHADDDVADQPVPAAFHDLAGEPAG